MDAFTLALLPDLKFRNQWQTSETDIWLCDLPNINQEPAPGLIYRDSDWNSPCVQKQHRGHKEAKHVEDKEKGDGGGLLSSRWSGAGSPQNRTRKRSASSQGFQFR